MLGSCSQVLSDEAVVGFLGNCSGEDGPVEVLYGQRRGEVDGLRWSVVHARGSGVDWRINCSKVTVVQVRCL